MHSTLRTICWAGLISVTAIAAGIFPTTPTAAKEDRPACAEEEEASIRHQPDDQGNVYIRIRNSCGRHFTVAACVRWKKGHWNPLSEDAQNGSTAKIMVGHVAEGEFRHTWRVCFDEEIGCAPPECPPKF